jgi:hypothetical protein
MAHRPSHIREKLRDVFRRDARHHDALPQPPSRDPTVPAQPRTLSLIGQSTIYLVLPPSGGVLRLLKDETGSARNNLVALHLRLYNGGKPVRCQAGMTVGFRLWPTG